MSKKGEFYEVTELTPHRYFQLVEYDQTQLNSDVIAVFNYTGELVLSTKKDVEKGLNILLDSGVEFFTHTSVTPGVRQGLWKRIGTGGIVDFSRALFKGVDYKGEVPDIEPYEADHYHSWVVWHINEPWQQIGSHIKDYPNAERGSVFAPENALYRMEHGQYPGVPFYGEVR